jgi:formylglycine-generating enzyme required for sulfatase activity
MIARVLMGIGAVGAAAAALLFGREALRAADERERLRALSSARDALAGEMVAVDAAFELDRSEVTVATYRACVTDGACSAPSAGEGCAYHRAESDARPVNCVDWDQAVAFCSWAGRRLPSAEEWDLAAKRGGACAASCPDKEAPCPVGAGGDIVNLCDNVSEWTATLDHGHRATRGAHFGEDADERAVMVHALAAGVRDPGQGFRCARSLEPSFLRDILAGRP